MGTFNSSKTVPYVVEDLAPVAQEVMAHFESQDYEVTEAHIPTGGVQVSIRRGLQGHNRYEDRPKHKDRAAIKRDQDRGRRRDLRPAGHSYGYHLARFLAGACRPGMEHGPRGQVRRGGFGRRRREPEISFTSTKRGGCRVDTLNTGRLGSGRRPDLQLRDHNPNIVVRKARDLYRRRPHGLRPLLSGWECPGRARRQHIQRRRPPDASEGGVYSGTRFAVNAISEALRQELIEDKIRVTMVEPGAVETELATRFTDEEAQQGVGPFINSTYSRPRMKLPPWPTASPGPSG